MKFWRKTIAIVSTFALLLNSLATPLTVFAQEQTPEPTPTATATPDATPIDTQTPVATVEATATPEVSPTPDATPAEIVTPTPEVTPVATDPGTPTPTDQPVETQAPESNQTVQGPGESATPNSTPTATPTFTPVIEPENASITTTVVETSVIPQTVQENSWFKLITDKLDYAPDEMAIITGSNFDANKTYSITVSSTDDPATSSTSDITIDGNGGFTFYYQLDGNPRPNYKVEVKDVETLVASTTFTDTPPGKITLCHWDSADKWTPNDVGIDSTDAKGHNDHSSDIIPSYHYDYWKGPVHYHGTYLGLNLSNIFEGFTGQQILSNGCVVPATTGSITVTKHIVPADSSTWNFTISGTGGTFTYNGLGNGQSHTFSNLTPGSYNITETTGSNYSTIVTCGGVGPLAQNGFLGTVVAGQDLACSFTNTRDTGSVMMQKNIIPHFGWNEGPEYTMTLAGPDNMSWTLGDGHLGGTTVKTGAYTLTESAYTPSGATEDGYTASYECTDVPPGYSGPTPVIASGNGKTVSFTLQKDHEIKCTFTNTLLGKLTIIKDSQPNDTENFVFNVSTPTGIVKTATLDDDGETHNRSNTATLTLPNGAYTVTESEEDGSGNWHLTNAVCTGPNQWEFVGGLVHVDTYAGTEMVCTFTNTKIAGHITLVKDLIPHNDWGTFNLKVNGVEVRHNAGDGDSSARLEYAPGRYTISETGHGDTRLDNYYSQYSCLDVARSDESVASGQGTLQTIELHDGDDIVCTFTNSRLGSIEGYKWNDLNGNGNWDQQICHDGHWVWHNWHWEWHDGYCEGTTEPKLSGWTFNLINSEGQIIDTSISDSSDYDFNNVIPGTYKVCEVQQSGWIMTYPNSGNENLCTEITVGAGADIDHVNFGNQLAKGTVTVTKFNDLNQNGTQDDGEPTIPGWTINLAGNDSQVTGENGQVTFDGVLQGSHLLGEDMQTGWVQTGISCSYDERKVGQSEEDGYYVNVTPGSDISCTIGNFQTNPKVVITKSNDKPNGVTASQVVTYTLTIENTGNVELDNINVQDVPPGGFTYVTGTTTIGGNPISDPTISSGVLSWTISSLAAGASTTIVYQLTTPSDLAAGTYTNFATCSGGQAVFVRGDTKVTVKGVMADCDPVTVTSTVAMGQSTNYGGNLQGQVLGASTSVLPATGSPTALLIVALAALGIGLFLRGYNLKITKKQTKIVVKSSKKTVKKSKAKKVSKKTKKHAKK